MTTAIIIIIIIIIIILLSSIPVGLKTHYSIQHVAEMTVYVT